MDGRGGFDEEKSGHVPPRACSVILRHKDSKRLLMSGSVTGICKSEK